MKTNVPRTPADPTTPTAENDSALLRNEAANLARQDGRTEARDEDRAAAFRERDTAAVESAQEIPAGDETLVTWDISPDETGHRTPESADDDEATVSADLAEEGSGEAEQDLRRAAADFVRAKQPSPGN